MKGAQGMERSRLEDLCRGLQRTTSRRSTLRALIAGTLAPLASLPEVSIANKSGKRRRRRRTRARQREQRAQEQVCQQVCGGSCQSCRAQCAACDDFHFCFHLTDGPPICKIGVIPTCEPCASDAECAGSQFCATGTTFDGATQLDPECGAYSVGVCMEELP
jgi:hypothetical protein